MVSNFRSGDLSDTEWEQLIESAGIIGKSNLILDDTPGISITELRSKCRKYKLEHNLGVVIFISIKKHNDIGILFNGSRFSQI